MIRLEEEVAAYVGKRFVKGTPCADAMMPASLPDNIVDEMARCFIGLGSAENHEAARSICCEFAMELALYCSAGGGVIDDKHVTMCANIYARRVIDEALSRNLLAETPELNPRNIFLLDRKPVFLVEQPIAALSSIYLRGGLYSRATH